MHQQGLGRTRHTGNQTVAAHVKGNEQVIHDVMLADNGAGNLVADIVVGRHELLYQLAGFFGIKCALCFVTHNAFLSLTYNQI